MPKRVWHYVRCSPASPKERLRMLQRLNEMYERLGVEAYEGSEV